MTKPSATVLPSAALGALLLICVDAAGAAARSQQPAFVRGANVSGGEFGSVPGKYATSYIYPSETEIQYYAARGFTALRVPFRWERVQHDLYGPLDVIGDGTGDFERFDRVVNWITDRGMIAILDPHNYGGRNVGGSDHKLGASALPAAALDDLWVRLANHYKGNERVWFNLMNEPAGISATTWKMVAQSATNAIRGTGASNLILVPGTSYTGAHSWISSGNAEAMASFVDPGDNFAFDVHQYLDRNSSGRQGTCVAGAGSSRLKAFASWLKAEKGRKGFLGEFGAGDPAASGQEQCASELAALLDEVESNKDVWIGWAAWGGGLWWGAAYHFRLEPTGGFSHPDTSYMKMLKPYLERGSQ